MPRSGRTRGSGTLPGPPRSRGRHAQTAHRAGRRLPVRARDPCSQRERCRSSPRRARRQPFRRTRTTRRSSTCSTGSASVRVRATSSASAQMGLQAYIDQQLHPDRIRGRRWRRGWHRSDADEEQPPDRRGVPVPAQMLRREQQRQQGQPGQPASVTSSRAGDRSTPLPDTMVARQPQTPEAMQQQGAGDAADPPDAKRRNLTPAQMEAMRTERTVMTDLTEQKCSGPPTASASSKK